jgi:transposase InsO family protein
MRSDLVLDALEQALHARANTEGLIHHSDRGLAVLVHSLHRALGRVRHTSFSR